MPANYFPTFANWFSSPTMPTWYSVTWFGETLQRQQYALLRILAAAHREAMNPAHLVRCLGMEHRGRFKRRLFRLADHLDAGVPLVEALEQTPEALDDDSVLAIRFGHQSGTLKETYELLIRDRNAKQLTPESEQSSSVYWVVIGITIVLLLSFMLTIIAPTFSTMLREFGMQPPASFTMLLSVSKVFTDYLILWVLLSLIVVGLAFSQRFRRYIRRSVTPRLARPVAQQRVASILRLIAIAIESGRPLAGSLSTLARYHFDSRVRQNLLFARNEIEQGVDAWQSLATSKLLNTAQAVAIAEAPDNATRSWILQRFAGLKETQAKQHAKRFATLVHPVVVLVFASIVAFIVIAFFSVLPQMIHSLA